MVRDGDSPSSSSGRPVTRTLGIDLGTTNTVAAYADGRIPRIVPTERGHNLLASVVAFLGEAPLIGQPARDQLLINPAQTVYGSKRLLGRAFHSPQAQQLRSRFAYTIVEDPRGRCAVDVGGRVRPLTEISATLLSQIATYARAALQEERIDGVVISVPAYYPLSQRAAVRKAGEDAGLDVWRLVNEPTAAALAYGIGRNVEQRVLVFDLGGGTFDVSVLEIEGGTFHVLATGGDGFLGGVDFDIRLAEHLLDWFEEDAGVRIRDDMTVVQRVLNAAEAAKRDLSMLQHADIRLPFLAQKRGKPVDLQVAVGRKLLEELTGDLVDRCVSLAEQVLGRAGLEPGDIDEVLVAGGQTRMPLIQQRIQERFGRAPRRGVHPDEVVAQGAALLARSLGHGDTLMLLDVLSVPLGVARRQPDGTMKVEAVLHANTTLPHEGEVVIDTWETDQVEMEIDLFQGETDDPLASEYIGTVLYDGISLGPAGSRSVHLSLHLDVEGLLTVRAHHGNEAASRVLPLIGAAPAYLRPAEVEPEPLDNPFDEPSLIRRLFRR